MFHIVLHITLHWSSQPPLRKVPQGIITVVIIIIIITFYRKVSETEKGDIPDIVSVEHGRTDI